MGTSISWQGRELVLELGRDCAACPFWKYGTRLPDQRAQRIAIHSGAASLLVHSPSCLRHHLLLGLRDHTISHLQRYQHLPRHFCTESMAAADTGQTYGQHLPVG